MGQLFYTPGSTLSTSHSFGFPQNFTSASVERLRFTLFLGAARTWKDGPVELLEEGLSQGQGQRRTEKKP